MDGTQRVAADDSCVVRARMWSALLGASLLGAACTAEISGGVDMPPESENQVFAGSPGPMTGGAGAGAAGSSVSTGIPTRPTGAAGGGAGSSGAPGSAGGAGAEASSGMSRDGSAGMKAPPTMNTAGAGGGAAAAGSGGQEPQGPDEPTETDEVVPGGVRWLGRVDARDPNAARFSWAGSGFAAVLKGTTLSVKLTSQSSSVFYQSVIDGEPHDRFEVETGDHTVTLATGLSDEAHTVEVYRDTEADGPISVFRGFEAGMLLGSPRASGRFIEVIGDSISAGYGSLGSERHGSNAGPGCGANASNSSWFHTYSAVAARALDAEVSTLARSGFGMVRGYGQNTSVMPPLFDDTLAGSNSPAWTFEHKPQAVIINLGTNDWNGGDPGTAYETAYIEFVTEVRMRYPDAWILLTVGSSLEPNGAKQCGTRLGNIVEARMEAGDDKIDSFDIGLQDSSTTGCGWHPNAAEHMRMGMVLTQELKAVLNW
ncbi:MAG TPA: SGNH/GDSL hydrolase family protein [Polyangiales bacterium]|nr:SGNH/GDSL hydrolase family protein [Polyangiales bacterium]